MKERERGKGGRRGGGERGKGGGGKREGVRGRENEEVREGGGKSSTGQNTSITLNLNHRQIKSYL